MMKKFLFLLLLCTLLCGTSCSGSGKDANYVGIDLTQNIDCVACPVAEDSTVAVRFSALVPLTGVSFTASAAENTADITLFCYAFSESYEKSLKKSPLEKYTFSDIPTRETTIFWHFKALPAGEYIFLFRTETGTLLFSQSPVPSYRANGKILFYADGLPKKDSLLCMDLLLVAESEDATIFFADPTADLPPVTDPTADLPPVTDPIADLPPETEQIVPE